MTGRQRLIVFAGIAISAVFLIFAFRDLRPLEVWGYIQSADSALLLVAVFWYFTSVSVITLRWRFLLRASGSVPFADLFQLVCIGYMGNNVYPLRGGEVLRIVLLGREHHIAVARATTVVIAERVFDGIVMLSFIVVALLTLNLHSQEVRYVATLTAPLFVAALVFFFALALNPNLSRKILAWLCGKLPHVIALRVQRLGEDVIVGLGALRTPSDLIGTLITSYGCWMLEAGTYWLVANAFGLGIDYVAVLLVVGVVNLAGLIPASPGQFGVYEGFVRLVLTSIGVAVAPATAYALAVHIVIWLPVTLVGFVFLARKGLNLSAMSEAERLTRQKEPVA